jgi:hypothetical protein
MFCGIPHVADIVAAIDDASKEIAPAPLKYWTPQRHKDTEKAA